LVLVLASSAFAFEPKAIQMREDFGTETLQTGELSYYYYIPCPTYSWFWYFTGFAQNDVVGHCFQVGDQGSRGNDPVDPLNCHYLDSFRVMDFAGYGTVYPGLFTVEFDIYCADECCGAEPITHLWNSGPVETIFPYNTIVIDPPLCLTDCSRSDPNFVITATHIGSDGSYPAWGADNISSALQDVDGPCNHDIGCLPAAYPRATCGDLNQLRVRSGYIGTFAFENWPPLAFVDGDDTTWNAREYGCIELAWVAYFTCGGPTATEPSSWGNIKSMYR
jgi:hypothetical protein